MTPITVRTLSLSRSWRPRTLRSPPNCRCQNLIAQNDHRLRAGRASATSASGPGAADAHHVERVERSVVPAEPLWIALAGPYHVADRGRDHAPEHRAAFCDFQELIDGIAETAAATRRAVHADARQPFDILVRKWIEDHRVKHAVDRGRRHDAGRQRYDRQQAEPRAFQQAADAVLNVTSESLEPCPHVALLDREMELPFLDEPRLLEVGSHSLSTEWTEDTEQALTRRHGGTK